ncbi:MAG: hypothetical protein J6R29_07215, partial [Clostridia bacterium]|nr:hypothetical protein [Clostridia bacterium]
MTGKIIGKRVVPNVFEVYEMDVGTSTIKFSVDTLNDGVNFQELKGFAHIDFESGRTDRVSLKKTIKTNEIVYTLPITSAITQEEGRHRMQLSFESDDLAVIYKTCIFTFVVRESIDGTLAFESVVPSVVNELEQKMENAVSECNNLKDETEQIAMQVTLDKEDVSSIKEEVNLIKEDAERYKQDTLSTYESTKQFYDTIQGSYVTSVNSKTGAVVLTASDIEGIEQPQLQPLYVDGTKYDGKSEVEVSTGLKHVLVSEESYDLHLENKTCVYIKNIRSLNLYSDKLENLSNCNAEIYLQIHEEIDVNISGKFYFYGDNCHYGIIKPLVGNYHLRFFSLEKNAKIYVEVKKLENVMWDNGIKNGFPVTVNYSDKIKYINQVAIYGNTGTEIVNGVETFAYPLRGVGEPVQGENGKTKYKIDIVTQNANMLSLPYCSDAIDSYNVTFDESIGQFSFFGTTCMDYESTFYLNKPIEKGNTIYFNAFNVSSGMMTELTSGN